MTVDEGGTVGAWFRSLVLKVYVFWEWSLTQTDLRELVFYVFVLSLVEVGFPGN